MIYLNVLPEVIIVFFGILILVLDLLFKKEQNEVLSYVSVIGCTLAFFACIFIFSNKAPLFSGMLLIDSFGTFLKCLILFATILTILLTKGYEPLSSTANSKLPEYYSLLLFSTLGMMLMVSANDFLTLYLGIELTALSLYVLVAFLRSDVKSSESAIKYFLLGAFSSAIMLYGITLVYGLAGTTNFNILFSYFSNSSGEVPLLLIVSLLFILVGIGFKIAMVPFHMWAPDIYEGAPTPITSFLAVASKSAGIAVLIRVFLNVFPSVTAELNTIIAVLAAITMTVGNIIAIPQNNIKRLLAYSGIAHIGYILIGFVVADSLGVQAILIYLLAYLFMNVGAFAIVVIVSNVLKSDDIEDFAGLGQRSSFLSALMLIFLLSLAGMPPLAGFIGKFYIFAAAIKGGFVWLAIIAVLNSVIALYYYLRIVKAMYFTDTKEFGAIPVPTALKVALLIITIFIFLIGIFPQPFINLVNNSVSLHSFMY
ncbi:MAG: NADH-quinone oxidoreductase subunit N [Candidatus Firestonebacteria bacterium]